jgi:hypothetical protein
MMPSCQRKTRKETNINLHGIKAGGPKNSNEFDHRETKEPN